MTFDVDGVLVDSEEISNNVIASLLSAEGLATTAEDARAEYNVPAVMRRRLPCRQSLDSLMLRIVTKAVAHSFSSLPLTA